MKMRSPLKKLAPSIENEDGEISYGRNVLRPAKAKWPGSFIIRPSV